MLDESKVPNRYWKEVVQTTIYILNKAQLRVKPKYTPYELWYGHLASVKHFRIFGSRCFIKNSDDKIGSFDSRCDEGIFLGYSSQSKAYKCFNKSLNILVETIHVKVDEVEQDKKEMRDKKEIRMDNTFVQDSDKDLKEADNKVVEVEEEIKDQMETLEPTGIRAT